MSSSPQNNDQKSSEGCHTLSPNVMIQHHQHQHQQQHLLQLQQQQQQQQMQNYQKHLQQQQHMQDIANLSISPLTETESSMAQKRKLYAIQEQAEEEEQDDAEDEDKEAKGVVGEEESGKCVESKRQKCLAIEALDTAYDADVDDDVPSVHTTVTAGMTGIQSSEVDDVAMEKVQKVMDEKQHIYEVIVNEI